MIRTWLIHNLTVFYRGWLNQTANTFKTIKLRHNANNLNQITIMIRINLTKNLKMDLNDTFQTTLR